MAIIKNDVTGQILSLLSIVGILSLAILAPNVVGIIGKPQYKFNRKKYQRSFYYLKQKGFIKISEERGIDILKLTKSGKAHAFRYYVDRLSINEPKIWDRLWRIVFFDVPDIMKVSRDTLHKKLKELGFYKLQESVFVHPYDCQKEIELLADVYQLRPYIRFAVVKSIDNEKELLKHFDLK